MKLTIKLWLTGVMSLSCLPAIAQADPTNYVSQVDTVEHVFLAHETTLDLFGSLSVGQETIDNLSRERVEDNGRLGAGVGLNHFVSRHVGVGLDAYTENTQHSFVDNASANLIIRFPFDSVHLAPYAFGGAGYQFDPTGLWFGQAGGGLDVRFTKKLGLFVDARYVFTDETQNFGVGRLGLRIGF
jgi:hypothetical protein